MLSSAGQPSMIIERMPRRSIFCPAGPPTLDSFMPCVRGLLAPIETLPSDEALVPARGPVAMTSFASGDNGSMPGETSWLSIFAVRHLPPISSCPAGIFSVVTSSRVMFTRIIFIFVSHCLLYRRSLSSLLKMEISPSGQRTNTPMTTR